jgi:hypothetical protein
VYIPVSEDSYATADVAQSYSFQDAILPIAQAIIRPLAKVPEKGDK